LAAPGAAAMSARDVRGPPAVAALVDHL